MNGKKRWKQFKLIVREDWHFRNNRHSSRCLTRETDWARKTPLIKFAFLHCSPVAECQGYVRNEFLWYWFEMIPAKNRHIAVMFSFQIEPNWEVMDSILVKLIDFIKTLAHTLFDEPQWIIEHTGQQIESLSYHVILGCPIPLVPWK